MTKSTTTPTQAIRLSVTSEVRRALKQAKTIYPTLSDPEILKLGLSKIVTVSLPIDERTEIRRGAAYSVGLDYLEDPAEDIYSINMGKRTHFT
jgi:hypothetical protein